MVVILSSAFELLGSLFVMAWCFRGILRAPGFPWIPRGLVCDGSRPATPRFPPSPAFNSRPSGSVGFRFFSTLTVLRWMTEDVQCFACVKPNSVFGSGYESRTILTMASAEAGGRPATQSCCQSRASACQPMALLCTPREPSQSSESKKPGLNPPPCPQPSVRSPESHMPDAR